MKQIFQKISLSSLLPLAVVVVFAILVHPVIITKPNTLHPQSNSPRTTPPPQAPVAAQQNTSAQTATLPTKQQAATVTAPKQAAIIDATPTEYVYRMFGSVTDPYASSDWTLAKSNTAVAWDISTGDNHTIVADIDTGFALAHQDLTNQWYHNADETGMTQTGDRCWTGTSADKSTNSCDDDNNGYIDDWRGWNFVKADNNPQAGRTNTSGVGVSHGTMTAGFIGATGNNGLGSTAINQHTKIMPLAVLNDDGIGYSSDIVAAIYYAVDNGANVINLSLGTYSNDPSLQTAITYALNHSIVIVAAAGNCGEGVSSDCPTAGGIAYPALYPDVIAVGASTISDQRASFGSYGSALDVSAPGYNLPVAPVWTPSNQISGYASGLYGTSFASPQVASLVSLIKSIRPSSSPGDIAALIDGTASKPANMNGLAYTQQLGHGIINAADALAIAQLLNVSHNTPALLQAGTSSSEHIVSPATSLASGCQLASGACTIQFVNDNGYTRYLPYTIAATGSSGWTWSSDMLDGGSWQIRARSGDHISNTPYYLLKKG